MTCHIIVNPAGASGNTIRTWNRIEPVFRRYNADYIVHYSTLQDGIEEICARLTSLHTDTDIVIVGGDGSMYCAVNGIRDFAHTRVFLIPAGSGNDLGKDLGITDDQEALVRKLLTDPEERQMDIGKIIYHDQYSIVDPATGKITDRHSNEPLTRLFNISAGMGFDAEICAEAMGGGLKSALNKMKLGKMIYVTEGVKLIFRASRYPAELDYAEEESEKYDSMLFAVGMNHCYEGGGFMFCPHADDQDGMLDVCIADGLSRSEFFRLLPRAYTGGHIGYPGIYERRTKEVTIASDVPLWVHTDGEVSCRSTKITLGVHDEKLRLLI